MFTFASRSKKLGKLLKCLCSCIQQIYTKRASYYRRSVDRRRHGFERRSVREHFEQRRLDQTRKPKQRGVICYSLAPPTGVQEARRASKVTSESLIETNGLRAETRTLCKLRYRRMLRRLKCLTPTQA